MSKQKDGGQKDGGQDDGGKGGDHVPGFRLTPLGAEQEYGVRPDIGPLGRRAAYTPADSEGLSERWVGPGGTHEHLVAPHLVGSNVAGDHLLRSFLDSLVAKLAETRRKPLGRRSGDR